MARERPTGIDPGRWLRERFAELQRRIETEDADVAELVADVVGESSTTRAPTGRTRTGDGHRVRVRITGDEGRKPLPESDVLTDADREALATCSDDVMAWLAERPEHRALFAVDQIEALSLACPDLDRGTLDRLDQAKRRQLRGLPPFGFDLDAVEIDVADATERPGGTDAGDGNDRDGGNR